MSVDAQLYQLLGQLEARLESISDLLISTSERIDKIEIEMKGHGAEISSIKQIQAKHAVIVTIAATVFSAIVVHMIKGG